MTGSNLKARQRQLREDAILEATQQLLTAKGYAELNMDEVAALAGIAKATLYQHFSSKDELVVNVVVRQLRLSEAALDRLDPSLPAIKRLELFLKQGIKYRASMWESNQRSASAVNVGQLPPKVQEVPAYQQQLARQQTKLAALINEAKAQGDLNSELSTPIILAVIVRLFQNSYNDLLSAKQATPEELSNSIIHIILDGIRSPK